MTLLNNVLGGAIALAFLVGLVVYYIRHAGILRVIGFGVAVAIVIVLTDFLWRHGVPFGSS